MEKKEKKLKNDKTIYSRADIAKRIVNKYKGLTFSDIDTILKIFIEEIEEIIIKENQIVRLNTLIDLYLGVCKKRGYDFTIGKWVERKDWFMLKCKAHTKFRLAIIKKSNVDFGYITECEQGGDDNGKA